MKAISKGQLKIAKKVIAARRMMTIYTAPVVALMIPAILEVRNFVLR
jgi:hypothetical protein